MRQHFCVFSCLSLSADLLTGSFDIYMCVFISGSSESSLLQGLFSWLWRAGASLQLRWGGLHSGVASLVVERGLSGVRAPWRWRVGSAVVALGLWSARSVVMPHRLRCPKVCGIILDQGSNPFSHTLTGGFFTTGPAGRPSVSFYGYC